MITRPIDPGHPDQIGQVLEKAREAGARGLLIMQLDTFDSQNLSILRRLSIANVESAEPPSLAVIQLRECPSLLISTSERAATAADMMWYLDMLIHELPVPPFQILAAVTTAVDSIHLDECQTALTFALSWGARPNPALDGQRPDAIWNDSDRMPALVHLARLAVLAVLARTAIAANEKLWKRTA